MKYYLVNETEVFIDPHGSPDNGAVKKYVITEELYESQYKEVNGKYLCHGEDIIDENDLQGSENEYNATCQFFSVEEISEEKYLKYKEIIAQYNKI